MVLPVPASSQYHTEQFSPLLFTRTRLNAYSYTRKNPPKSFYFSVAAASCKTQYETCPMKVASARRPRLWSWRHFFIGAAVVIIFYLSLVNDFSQNLAPPLKISGKGEEGLCIDLPSSVVAKPKSFMEEGPGKEYLDLYKEQLHVSSRHRRLLKIRFIVYEIFAASKCKPIYYHIHKNGGSTMNFRTASSGLMQVRGDSKAEAYYTPREREMGRYQFENETMAILLKAMSSGRDMPVFTFLRDPVSRFLSSVGQALKLNQLGTCTKHANSKDTVDLLVCILDHIQTNKHFLDEHLEPQIFELYHGLMGLDLNVNVMDMTAINVVLTQVFGSHMEMSRRQSHGIRVVAGYNLSTSILTQELVERICSAYEMDVLFLQETKVVGSICLS